MHDAFWTAAGSKNVAATLILTNKNEYSNIVS
jgi:hypothetical protein